MSDHESGDERQRRVQAKIPNTSEEELASKSLQIQSKRFYLDVKQNKRGRFIKIAEVAAGGRKNRILLSMSTAAEFRDHLTDFSDHYASLGPPNPETVPENGKLKSEVIAKSDRRYYLDLKENQRGRFLRVAQAIRISGMRTQIAIPAQGMIEFKHALTELLEEYGTEDHESQVNLPESQTLKVENKTFYFDVGENNRGVYMRISEVMSKYKSIITIPERSWGQFRDILTSYVEQAYEDEAAGTTAPQ